MIVVLVLVDILVMSLWFGVDTPHIVTTTLESQVSKVLREAQKGCMGMKFCMKGNFVHIKNM